MSTYVPLEIELEIMKRLPVKSLIRFMSVCKAWKSMIEWSEFVAGYRVIPNQPQHLMINLICYEVADGQQTYEVKFVCFEDDDPFPQQKIAPTLPPILQLLHQPIIIDSSSGLLCLDGFLQEPDNSQTFMAVLWNPSIRKSIAVALPSPVHQSFRYVIGFGVCPHTNDPKLVKITYIVDRHKIESISCIPRQVEVFALSHGGWKILSCSNLPRKSIAFVESQAAAIGQFIYFLAYDRIDMDFNDPCNLIMSFDMSTEEFREIDIPDSLTDVDAESDLRISRLKESLAMVEFSWIRCDVWMMEHGDSKAFTKLFSINVPNALVRRILGFRKSGEPIIEMQDDGKDPTSALAIYEPCSKHIMELGIRGNIWLLSGSSYTESLLLLDHDDGHIIM